MLYLIIHIVDSFVKLFIDLKNWIMGRCCWV